MKQNPLLTTAFLFCATLIPHAATAQAEVMGWGNLTGIRVEGERMEFESRMCVMPESWDTLVCTRKEAQRSDYDREGNSQTVTTRLREVDFIQTVTDREPGSVSIHLKASGTATPPAGVFFCLELPSPAYAQASILNGQEMLDALPQTLRTSGLHFEGIGRSLLINLESAAEIHLRRELATGTLQCFVALVPTTAEKGWNAMLELTLTASGAIDHSPATLTLDAGKSRRRFDGLGGNFRLQFPKTDPQVIRYCLDHLRVAWGRVEMPWQFWHPEESSDPIAEARAGNLHPHVLDSMRMAQDLASRGMPVIVSDWKPPAWAVIGDPANPHPLKDQGIYGMPLRQEKIQAIYRSIGDYLEYLKSDYGVEAEAFSFNESDLGINVRQTAAEHADFIRGFGAHLASRGLATRLLLGDNSDATTFDFIVPALEDERTHKYISAVSFHSWRGCDDATLDRWASAARKLNLPLIIGEGSTDAGAYKYPEIFYEESFALNEIELYIRICARCQPISILQWQLTTDYAILSGEGIYNTEGALRPSRRFWNLQQLASTPEGAFSLPLSADRPNLFCAAFGNAATGRYAFHIVNNGAARTARITGIPSEITGIKAVVTDAKRSMEVFAQVPVVSGEAVMELPPAAFVSLFAP
jgi:hypothetical protein